MAETYQSGRRMTWKGTWQLACIYCEGDLVSHNELLVLAKEYHTSAAGNEPGTAGGEDYWTDPTAMLPNPGEAGSPIYSDGLDFKSDADADMKMKSAQAEDGIGATQFDGRQLDIQDAAQERGLTVTPEGGASFSDINTGGSVTIDDTGVNFADSSTSGKITAAHAASIVAGDQIIKEVVCNSTRTLTASELSGSTITNNGQSAAVVATLDTCAPGLWAEFEMVSTGVGSYSVKAGPNDKFLFNGAWLDDGDKLTNSNPSAGDSLRIKAIPNGAGYDWHAVTILGAWQDTGA